MSGCLFVTGGTGFLGKALLARLADLAELDKVYVLTRASSRDSATQRIERLLQSIFSASKAQELSGKVEAVVGDLTEPNLGIDTEQRELLASKVTHVLHVGASTEFGSPLDEARLFNVTGTKHVIEFALECCKSQGQIKRFDYVSTAYVAGTKAGTVHEDTLARSQKFSNSYEQSKYEAEVLVRAYKGRLPTTIHRPSIVVGDSRNGFTPHFKVLYWPLRLLAKDFIPFFATNVNARLDVVPVDYVADGIVALMSQAETIGETFHLTAGMGREIRIREFLSDAYQYMKVKRRPVIPFWLFRVIQHSFLSRFFDESFWEAVRLAEPYNAYLRGSRVRFDNRKTSVILDRYGICAPHWRQYKKEILNYCISSRWGKRLPLPEYIYYLPATRQREGFA